MVSYTANKGFGVPTVSYTHLIGIGADLIVVDHAGRVATQRTRQKLRVTTARLAKTQDRPALLIVMVEDADIVLDR